jgi:hypothetical protein
MLVDTRDIFKPCVLPITIQKISQSAFPLQLLRDRRRHVPIILYPIIHPIQPPAQVQTMPDTTNQSPRVTILRRIPTLVRETMHFDTHLGQGRKATRAVPAYIPKIPLLH